ncbi:FtsH protease activity modulator HflK [Rosenbergiella australiborealis]|uniref:FtsH protease activity modulator HflK n=1 Tax=Rosenbergiella australiborealis TaxID=1544696 RepID=UPI001F4DA922|nr:FtsH protease activity modulator HflK [Rosenbergiella australiborealis]
MMWKHPGNQETRYRPLAHNSGADSQHASLQHGPPDLDKLIRHYLTKCFFRVKHRHGGTPPLNNKNYLLLVLPIVIVLSGLWFVSGFYTIGEAERGVVTRLGKFHHLVQPGLNWHPPFIDRVTAVNVASVKELATTGSMLTADENVVRVEMNVQYRVVDPERYLYSVVNAEDSLRQATDSALRGVIGRSTMDRVLTEGRTVVRSETQREIEQTILPYQMGLAVLDVNFQAARPPEEVKAAFDDAIAARENREQYVREAEAYANEVQPRANGQAQRILEDARAYKARTVLEAEGEAARFSKILPEYRAAPAVTKQRLYIETMEKILAGTPKVLNGQHGNTVTLLPLDQLFKRQEHPPSVGSSESKKTEFGIDGRHLGDFYRQGGRDNE